MPSQRSALVPAIIERQHTAVPQLCCLTVCTLVADEASLEQLVVKHQGSTGSPAAPAGAEAKAAAEARAKAEVAAEARARAAAEAKAVAEAKPAPDNASKSTMFMAAAAIVAVVAVAFLAFKK